MAKDELTKEELDAVNKDIEKAKQDLASQQTEAMVRAREEGRKEAEKEAELKRQWDEQERKTKDLESKLAESQRIAAEQLKMIQTKVDDLSSSKAVVVPRDPFKAKSDDVDRWDTKQVEKLETAAARSFFGPDYDRMLDR